MYSKNLETWFTIDIEKLDDSNFAFIPKKDLHLDYEKLLYNWLDFCDENSIKSTGFILGTFAKEFPHLVKEFKKRGHEVACHGLTHELVYNLDQKQWKSELKEAKVILEDLIGEDVNGYRSPSWSLPFDESYYEDLISLGFWYSSSYFPFKTYMYGHDEDKKSPFNVSTKSGEILEIPVPKNQIPFSGGFYLRALPLFVQKILQRGLVKKGVKPVVYIHPYEMMDENLFMFYKNYFKVNKDFILGFFSTSTPKEKLKIYV